MTLLVPALLSLASPALAEPGDTCISGFEHGQEAKKQGHAVKARGELRLCAGACPEVLAAECRGWLAEVEKQIGRVRVEPRDAEGRPIEAAVIEIDGEPPAAGELEVDPGAHAITVKAPGYLPFSRNIEVGAGATVPVQAVLAKLPPPAPTAAPPSRRPLVIGLGVAGGLSLLAGGALLVGGKIEEGRLAGTCRPNCPPESVDVVANLWIGGGVAAGAGALLGAAALLVWSIAPVKNTASITWRLWIDPAGGGGIVGTGDL